MQYEEALNFIHSLDKFGIKPGMERIAALCRAIGDLQRSLRCIHVAGTNGKGSTSTMLANICTAAGYRTGLFVSPYVLDFRERIQINGQMIPKNDLAKAIETLSPVVRRMQDEGSSPTEFELITAAAFLYFSEQKCDVVVLETGLGGRLDSTNIIPCPLVNVIASVSFDHMAILGDTIRQIAIEKCGTIKEGAFVVSYPLQHPDALDVIRSTTAEKHGKLVVPNAEDIEILSESICGTDARIEGLQIRVPLLGRHMVYNASMAVCAARLLRERGLAVSDDAIRHGIGRTRMPARMEIWRDKPLVIADGGHNEDCANALRDALQRFLPGKRIVGVCGMMADKAFETYLSVVAPLFERMFTIRADHPRALSAQELAVAARAFCTDVHASESFSDAAQDAMRAAGEDGVVVLCGSFYTVGDMKKVFNA